MRPIGFSTGALAKGDWALGLDLSRVYPRIRAVALSALREAELLPLVDAARSLDLSHFDYVSFHAPSKLVNMNERVAFELLARLPEAWPLVVHPELLKTPELWKTLGGRLCIENMDGRKTFGRTVEDLQVLFHTYPEAGFCLDLGHARQVDPTMAGALLMLMEFGSRLRQLHISDVGAKGEHLPISTLGSWAYARVAHRVPLDCPLIVESVVGRDAMAGEVNAILAAFGG